MSDPTPGKLEVVDSLWEMETKPAKKLTPEEREAREVALAELKEFCKEHPMTFVFPKPPPSPNMKAPYSDVCFGLGDSVVPQGDLLIHRVIKERDER